MIYHFRIVALLTSAVISIRAQGGLDCAFRGQPTSLLGGDIQLNHIVNQEDRTLTVEYTYNGIGWVAFGTSDTGMVGAEIVLCQPLNTQTLIGKYGITSQSPAGITLLPNQSLENASCTQENDQTIMKYTKKLVEEGERTISTDGGTFVFAHGSSNTFQYHGVSNRGQTRFPSLIQCLDPNNAGDPNGGVVPVVVDNSAQEAIKTQNLFLAHGWLMAISWAILVPLAIGFSLLRAWVPGNGTWFKLHSGLNMLAFLCVSVAFGLAVNAVKRAYGGVVDFGKTRHRTVGLVLYILLFVQILMGVFRPHLPEPHAPAAPATTGDEEADDADNEPTKELDVPKKSNARIAFEIGHRVWGLTILGLAWYQCYTGITAIVVFFGADADYWTTILWAVIGSLAGSIILARIATFAIKKK